MKKFFVTVLGAFLFFSSFSVYSVNVQAEETKPPTVLGEFVKLEDGNWLNLTKEQKAEDLDFLYEQLKENFPYFNVIKRMINIDFEDEYKKFSKEAIESKNDAEFFVLLETFMRRMESIGHLSLFSPLDYFPYVEMYQEAAKEENDAQGRMYKMAEAYGNKKSQESYTKMNEIFNPVFERVQQYYSEKNNDIKEEIKENIKTEIIEEGKTAYIYVGSFDMSLYDEDKKKLFDFYSQVENYENVIFDFTENGGGGMFYFDDLIAAPNIDKELKVPCYGFIKNGEYNIKFLGSEDFEPISTMPKLPKMNKDDFENLDLVSKFEYSIYPLSDKKMLNGKIWILINENVFSSSEYAAMFTKYSGFATLVGTQTGGDGIGVDPLPIVMPNSGFIVRYSPIYGTTADGASSQEFGTTPDFISPEGESPLETCLKLINK